VAPLDAPLIAIVGPTGAGKSDLAMHLAREREGEIVSCDSLQVYRGLDIGSAKATAAERAEVPHHLLDVVDPDQPFSAADYSHLARAAIREISARARLPVVVGGTGLYLRALLQGLFPGPSRSEPLRRRFDAMADRFGDIRLWRLLRRVDPAAAGRISPSDRVRVVRALEVFWGTGKPISEHHRAGTEPLRGFRTLIVGLDPGREELRRRLEKRTRDMLRNGLLEEVRGLQERYGSDIRPLQAIGYKQALSVIQGRMSEDEGQMSECEHAIVQATLRFAKRQRTWFRHQTGDVQWRTDAEGARQLVSAWLDGPPTSA
jgi:tRNA dimethylallyltransferase